MANVQKQMRDVDANLQSHAYDLSERHLFSAKVGQLLPVYNKQVVPGDYFEIDPVAFLRSQRVNTASYARMRQHVDFFFVPYWQLWHRFGAMKYQRNDPTSAYYTHLPVCSPYLTLSELYGRILHQGTKLGDGTEVGTEYRGSKDSMGYFDITNSARLCDLLGYGSLQSVISKHYDANNQINGVQVPSIIPSPYNNKHVTMWPWLAYQKIWNDFYRNPWFDINPDPLSFNLDDIEADDPSSANFSGRGSDIYEMIKLRYRQWKRDYFTGLFPNKQFGDVSMVVGSSVFKLKGLSGDQAASMRVSGDTANITGGPNSVYAYDGTDNLSLSVIGGISAIDIRRSQLLQIWKEKTLRAGFHTDVQQKAHFGVDSDYMPDEHVKHLGGFSEVINISEVVSTSLNKTGLSADSLDGLGELGGKGTSLGQGAKIRFKAKDDGIIMAIYSILPESEYNSNGLSADHMRVDPFEYFTPAFQNLGFEAIIRGQLDIINITADDGSRPISDPIGYAPPYYDMKTGIDKVHGEFIQGVPNDSSVLNLWANYSRRGGSLQAFDAARRDATNIVKTLPFFYVNPNVVDSVFAFNADSFEDTDEFFVNMYLDIKAVRPMSVLGLPNF